MQRDRAVYAPTIANWGDAKLSDYAVEDLATAIERSLASDAQEEPPRAPQRDPPCLAPKRTCSRLLLQLTLCLGNPDAG
jgi:hypothetical protein